MAWGETFTHWQFWAGAVLVTSLVYAILKIAVPVGEAAKKRAVVGMLLTATTKDTDFAKIGRRMAVAQWQKRKRVLLLCSAVVGVLMLSTVCHFVPEMIACPAWASGLAAAAGVGIFLFSKY